MRIDVIGRQGVKGSWRSLICLVVLFTFTVQSFLIQTHIHDLAQFRAAPAAGVSLNAPTGSQPLPDADKCLLCMEYLHGGVYLPPAAIGAMPPTVTVSLLPFVIAPLHLARIVSHSWMGRAPPRA
jgi:hypothetical protein